MSRRRKLGGGYEVATPGEAMQLPVLNDPRFGPRFDRIVAI